MRFAFRVDSSPKIGMGHIMRCLTLANGLRKSGFECYFICRDFAGNGVRHVKDSGFQLELLSNEGVVLNSTWLGVPLQHDVNDTLRVMSAKPVDWLVVDHYDIDKQWEAQVRSGFPAVKVLVIDDLADRAHDCDVLVDQTYGRGSQEYQGLVPQDAKFCLGTDFALLRPQFKELKERYAEQEKSRDSICHILVTLGGGDNCQPVQVIGKALKKLAQDQSFSVTVITGNTPEKLLADYKDLTGNVEFIGFSSDVENEMAKADFVIGAGGGTSWERCCMGLPTVVLTIADNQIEIARILNDKRAGISVDTNVDEIASAAKTLLVDHSLRLEMSKNAARLCDGNGVARVIGEIISSSLEFKSATLQDAQFIYDARYADEASKFYRNKNIPDFEDHVTWLEDALANNDRVLACLCINEEKIAHVRIDKDPHEPTNGEIGICLSKEWRGKGIGQAVLNAANSHFADMGYLNIYAEVHEMNIASANIFRQAGYTHLSTDRDGFMRYLWQA